MESISRTLRRYIELVESLNQTFVSVTIRPALNQSASADSVQQFSLTLAGRPDDAEIRKNVHKTVVDRFGRQPLKIVWQRVQQGANPLS